MKKAEKFEKMLIESTSEEVRLPDLPGIFEGHKARLIIEKAGLEKPAVSDKARVKATMVLPTRQNKCPWYLHPELHFGKRISKVMGEWMDEDWGRCAIHYEQYADVYFSAPTYQEAFKKARQYLHGEIGKLVAALEARRNVLLGD